jgi:hypothetical protein
VPLWGAHKEIPWEQGLLQPCPFTPAQLLHSDQRAQYLEALSPQVLFCELF